jgi:hypothetical protein
VYIFGASRFACIAALKQNIATEVHFLHFLRQRLRASHSCFARVNQNKNGKANSQANTYTLAGNEFYSSGSGDGGESATQRL